MSTKLFQQLGDLRRLSMANLHDYQIVCAFHSRWISDIFDLCTICRFHAHPLQPLTAIRPWKWFLPTSQGCCSFFGNASCPGSSWFAWAARLCSYLHLGMPPGMLHRFLQACHCCYWLGQLLYIRYVLLVFLGNGLSLTMLCRRKILHVACVPLLGPVLQYDIKPSWWITLLPLQDDLLPCLCTWTKVRDTHTRDWWGPFSLLGAPIIHQAIVAWLINVMEQPLVLFHLILSIMPLSSYQMNYLTLIWF